MHGGHKRLILVTGKGGAGKSVVAASLALHFAKQRKKVWLVELGRKGDSDFSRLPSLLDVGKLSHEPTSLTLTSDGIFDVSVLDPTASLAEYVGLKLSVGRITNLVIKNRVTGSLLEIVPGLPELVTLGKIWYALTQAKPHLQPDLVVIDGPASGHAVTLLHAPKNFARLTRTGPLYRDATAMLEFLRDQEQTEIHLTGLPEELALRETEEHFAMLSKEFSVPRIWVNKCFPKIEAATNVPDFYQATYDYTRERFSREEEALEKYKSTLPKGSVQKIPFFFPEPDAAMLPVRVEAKL